MTKRCAWAGEIPIYVEYHDNEWGKPVHEDRVLFEFLILEGAQAGLSWLTILKKRKNYRKAFDHFNVKKISNYNKKKIEALLKDEGIVRNRLKVEGAVKNAKAFLQVQKEFGSFNQYLWSYVKHQPIQNRFRSIKDLPARTELSDAISKDLKKRGFTFVGSTIIYAFMQAVGVVNDHLTNCFCFKKK